MIALTLMTLPLAVVAVVGGWMWIETRMEVGQ